jgi:hypothetical protein
LRRDQRDHFNEAAVNSGRRLHTSCDRDGVEQERLGGRNFCANSGRQLCAKPACSTATSAAEQRRTIGRHSAKRERNDAAGSDAERLDRFLERNNADDIYVSVAAMRLRRRCVRPDLGRERGKLRSRPDGCGIDDSSFGDGEQFWGLSDGVFCGDGCRPFERCYRCYPLLEGLGRRLGRLKWMGTSGQ